MGYRVNAGARALWVSAVLAAAGAWAQTSQPAVFARDGEAVAYLRAV